MNNTVYNFARHCLADKEFNCGGIPTKEEYYCKKLGWKKDSKELSEFYKAVSMLWRLKNDTN